VHILLNGKLFSYAITYKIKYKNSKFKISLFSPIQIEKATQQVQTLMKTAEGRLTLQKLFR
jgi:hypothetical protein